MIQRFVPLTLVLGLWLAACQPKVPSSENADRTAQRVDSVLRLMTLDEKIGQLNLLTSDWDVTGPTLRSDYKELIRSGSVGNIFNAHTVAYVRSLQKIAVEETRLGIPLLFGYDVIHGHKTIFPIPLAEAASWDLEAIQQAAHIAAVEATASGLHWTFAPMVDIARDPRWGRVMEGAGEDVYLGARIAEARVRGFQGSDLAQPNTLLACAKHYAAYGAAQAGRDYHTVDMSEIELRNTYLPPFRAALEAGVASFMTSFNELNGVPATGNRFLLKDILRNEWGFEGFVVTDYTSINEMVLHGFARNERHAADLAFGAGVDMDMQGSVYHQHLKSLVQEGRVSEAEIDQRVRFILRKKFELGLFDDPYRYCSEERERSLILSPEHLQAARTMAQKSFVLLKNEQNTLPLGPTHRRIALIGPLANTQHHILGAWRAAGDTAKAVSLLQAMRQQPGIELSYAPGCDIDGPSRAGFDQALRAARQADVVVLALGESTDMSGEAASRSDIGLPGQQLALIEALATTQKPIVLVLMNGRPLVLTQAVQHCSAVLETWLAGTMAGPAIVDVLWGAYNPAGKLPITFPRALGQVPIYYNMKNTGRPATDGKYTSKYLDVSNKPLFAFGHGLSYTQFEYSDLALSDSLLRDSLVVSVQLHNRGALAGEEVAQLYIRQHTGSITRPVRELKAFQKLKLDRGQSQTLRFVLRPADLMFYNAQLHYGAEPGRYDVFVGGSSEATLGASFDLK